MAYGDHTQFIPDYTEVEAKLKSRMKGGFIEVGVDAAWALYVETLLLKGMGVVLDGFPSQFFGRLVTDWEELLTAGLIKLKELPIGIGKEEKKNLLTLDNYIENGGKWTPLINDCWLLAGVNSLQRYYACSPITWDNILHPKYVVTATGRELIGLALAGYDEVTPSNDWKGKVYRAGDAKPEVDRARNLSLVEYDEAVSKLREHGEVRGFLNKTFKID